MQIARQLKKENIVEYLLYMWQLEDLIRAYQLDIALVDKQIISRYKDMPAEEVKACYEWYESLIEMMKLEGVQEKGHLQLNKNIIIDLNELHQNLLKSGKDAAYPAKFYHILPFITQLRNQQTDADINDVEICFNFLYGILMLRIQGKEISPETSQAQEEITKFMILLAKNYNLHKSGELNFD